MPARTAAAAAAAAVAAAAEPEGAPQLLLRAMPVGWGSRPAGMGPRQRPRLRGACISLEEREATVLMTVMMMMMTMIMRRKRRMVIRMILVRLQWARLWVWWGCVHAYMRAAKSRGMWVCVACLDA
eukprot:scaffold90055_cov21-Tisochrysis_lutea.AAC.3